jgi:hypothetical protein
LRLSKQKRIEMFPRHTGKDLRGTIDHWSSGGST